MLDLNMFYNLYTAAQHKFDLFRYVLFAVTTGKNKGETTIRRQLRQ